MGLRIKLENSSVSEKKLELILIINDFNETNF